MEIEPGIILIDKPEGISSFDVIRKLRKIRGIWKMGHAGTLDPLASGLMIIALGDATKKLADYLKLPKSYAAEIVLGVRTATGDREGEILEAAPARSTDEEVRAAAATMKGKIELAVPAYSAIKVDGKRLYEKARAGETFALPVKTMEVTDFEISSVRQEGERVVVSCTIGVASGTYIRSIAEELGRRLGVPASLQSLRRISIGKWNVEHAEKLS